MLKLIFILLLFYSIIKFNSLKLEEGFSYYYDGLENNGGIIQENDILNFIIDKNPYLLVYMQS